ncbi:MAG: TlpA family protein disulfide reductase [FCB group bacterium]|nr:TlpA family protein disulfide reductase [FCB group bacterium]
MKTRLTILTFGLLLISAMISLGCGGDETPQTTSQPANQPAAAAVEEYPGERFVLTDIYGEKRIWSEFVGKPFAINFWATWCGPCRREIPILKRLYTEYKPQGFEILGISVDRDQKKVVPFAKQIEMPWVVLYTDAETIEEFKLGQGIPYTIFFDAAGNETGRVIGAQPERVFRRELAKIFPSGS